MRSPNRKHDLPLLNKYVTAATAIAILSTQTVRLSSPLLFNDPFDVQREWEGLEFDELEDAIIERFRAYFRGEATPSNPAALKLLQLARDDEVDARDERFFNTMRIFLRAMRKPMEGFLSDFKAAWKERLPNLRIMCFSEDPASAAMWAHYSANHTGVVLQFASSDERDSVWLLAEPVIYQQKKPSLPSASEWARAFMGETELDWDIVLREYQFVKDPQWSWEKEYRVVTAKKASETGLFSDDVFFREDLRGVILGAAIAPEAEHAIRGLCAANYPDTTIYRSHIDQSRRSITITPLT